MIRAVLPAVDDIGYIQSFFIKERTIIGRLNSVNTNPAKIKRI